MKIKPQKKYKKPIYAAGLASLIAVTGAVSGCSSEANLSFDGAIDVSSDSSTSLQYDGDIVLMGDMVIEESSESEENSVSAETNIPPLTLEGDIALPSDSIDE